MLLTCILVAAASLVAVESFSCYMCTFNENTADVFKRECKDKKTYNCPSTHKCVTIVEKWQNTYWQVTKGCMQIEGADQTPCAIHTEKFLEKNWQLASADYSCSQAAPCDSALCNNRAHGLSKVPADPSTPPKADTPHPNFDNKGMIMCHAGSDKDNFDNYVRDNVLPDDVALPCYGKNPACVTIIDKWNTPTGEVMKFTKECTRDKQKLDKCSDTTRAARVGGTKEGHKCAQWACDDRHYCNDRLHGKKQMCYNCVENDNTHFQEACHKLDGKEIAALKRFRTKNPGKRPPFSPNNNENGVTCHGYFSQCVTLKHTYTVTRGHQDDKGVFRYTQKMCLEESEKNTEYKQCKTKKNRLVKSYQKHTCGWRTCKVAGNYCNDNVGDGSIEEKEISLVCTLKNKVSGGKEL